MRVQPSARSRPAVRLLAAGMLAAVALGLMGCTQVAAIAPVGGNHLSETRYAAIDVLTTAGTPILTAPVCTTQTDETITCTGSTVSGETITAVSAASDKTSVTVTVGTTVLYSGSILDVLDDAARKTS